MPLIVLRFFSFLSSSASFRSWAISAAADFSFFFSSGTSCSQSNLSHWNKLPFKITPTLLCAGLRHVNPWVSFVNNSSFSFSFQIIFISVSVSILVLMFVINISSSSHMFVHSNICINVQHAVTVYNSPLFIFKNTRSSKILCQAVSSSCCQPATDREDTLHISLRYWGQTTGPLPVAPAVDKMPEVCQKDRASSSGDVEHSSFTCCSIWSWTEAQVLPLFILWPAADWESSSDRNLNRFSADCAEVPVAKLELAADVDEDAAGMFAYFSG